MSVHSGLFLLLTFVMTNVAVTKEIYHFPPKQGEIYVNGVVKCAEELGYDTSILKQIQQGKYTDDDRAVKAMVCANSNLGYGYPDGRLDVDKTIRDLFPTKPDIRSAFVTCNLVYGITPVETFKGFLLCFKDEIPFKVLVS